MIARAEAKYIRIAPLKVRRVIDLVRGKGLNEAFAILTNIQRRAGLPVKKLLDSALSNAKQKVREITPEQLVISHIEANGGPMLKRHRAGSMGRAMPILKRTTHIQVSLEKGRR